MSNNQKKKLAAQQHNEQYEQSKLPKFIEKVSSTKMSVVSSALMLGLCMLPKSSLTYGRKSRSTKVKGY